MTANLETLQRIERRAEELALIHGGQPTPQDWSHAARELLHLASPSPGAHDLLGYMREPENGTRVLRSLRA